MNRAEKEVEVQNLQSGLQKSAIAISADYRGLSVAQITKLRRSLHEKGIRAKVVKNTLARIAAKNCFASGDQAQLEKFVDSLIGPSFLALSESDPVTPAKVLVDFAKDNEKLQIKGAWFENKFLDRSGVKEISSMPSREETLAKLLALLNTPATQLLRLMKEPASQVVRVFGAQKDKLEKGA